MSAKNIIWLASYPKSGNTWARAFLLNYLADTKKPASINQLHSLSFGDSGAGPYGKLAGRSATGLSDQKVLQLRPKVLQAITGNGADINFVKTHNSNVAPLGHRLIPPRITKLAIYIVRNPMDVALSYATHYGQTKDHAITSISHPDNAVDPDANNVRQFLGSWSDHVSRWTKSRDFPIHVVRYEDMEEKPGDTFGALIKRLGMSVDQERLKRAIKHASFRELQSQEQSHGFKEQSDSNKRFFDKGRSGRWKDELTEAQVARIKKDHRKIMQKHGYL